MAGSSAQIASRNIAARRQGQAWPLKHTEFIGKRRDTPLIRPPQNPPGQRREGEIVAEKSAAWETLGCARDGLIFSLCLTRRCDCGRAHSGHLAQDVDRFIRLSLDIASNTMLREVTNTTDVIRKGPSTPVWVIVRAVKSPAIPVHQ